MAKLPFFPHLKKERMAIEYVTTKEQKTNLRTLKLLEITQKVVRMGSWDFNLVTREVFYSQQMLQLMGRSDDHPHIVDVEEALSYVHPKDRERYRTSFNYAISQRQGFAIEYRIIHDDGSIIYVTEQVELLYDENKNPTHLIGVTQDITKARLIEKKFKDQEKRFQNIYENLSLGIRSFDREENKILMITPGIEEITGYHPSFFYSYDAWEMVIHPDDRVLYQREYSKLKDGKGFHINYRITKKDGQIAWVEDKTIPVLDKNGNLVRTDGIISDISKQKEYEEKISHLAFHDPLTKLPNRLLFQEKMDGLLQQMAKSKDIFSILYIDLDRFRNINSTLGQGIGDKLLIEFSRRMSSLLNDTSFLARLSGDVFGVLLWDYRQRNDPETFAKTIIDSLKVPFLIDGFELFMTASIGISTYPNDGKNSEDLVKSSDAALYRAKVNGNGYQIYSSSLNISSYKQYELDKDLRKAIVNDQLLVFFQPRVDPLTGKILSAEALIRWEHPVWGIVSPTEFIPLAEESGFINDIGDWVLREACHFLTECKKSKLPLVPISINISAQRFLRNDWKETMVNTISQANVDPTLIELEITETTLIQHESLIESAFQFLRDYGIKIALDDFGTGYSSLSHIKDFAISTIKIDKSFTEQITKSANVEMIIKSLIFMAKGLNMNIVAEGVETIEQLNFLKQQECHEIQGYIYSKPVPSETFRRLLSKLILKPLLRSEPADMSERRKYFRMELLFPLSAGMTLESIQGKNVKLGKTEVLIENIGPDGLRFLSTIQLPVRADIIYTYSTVILDQTIQLKGQIVWKQEEKGLYQYGVQFIIKENERDILIRLLNHLSVQIKNNASLPSCRFITEDRWTYLRRLQ